MGAMIDLTGMRMGAWSVLRRAGSSSYKQPLWACRCDCGTERDVAGPSLRRGLTHSCGCTKGAAIAKAHTKHGHARGAGKTEDSRTYRIWQAMRARCAGKSEQSKKYYAAAGITVCDRWNDFNNFLADMGEAPDGLTIDRRDNSKGYEPGNCRWASYTEQANNRRPRNSVGR